MSTFPGRAAVGGAGVAAVSLIWFGLVLGTSFLATPVKFLAPSLTLPVALDVGRQTFHALAWVELAFCLVLAGLVLVRPLARRAYALAAAPCAIVMLEIAWLLPVLDARVGMIIAGATPPPSNLHLLYIVLEALKLAALLALGIAALRPPGRAERADASVQ